jgi:hypothetical protein
VKENEPDPRKRAFTRAEPQEFFGYCDDQVARIRAFHRKGWLRQRGSLSLRAR